MVILGKILPLVAVGAAMLFIINAFTRPAQATASASALSSTFGSIGTAGQSIATLGEGIGAGLAGLFQPFWEISNLFERFGSLSVGSANVSAAAHQGSGEGNASTSSASVSVSGGSSGGGSSVAGVTNTNPGVRITGGSPGVTGTVR